MNILRVRAWDKENNEMLYPDDTDKILFEINEYGITTYDVRYLDEYGSFSAELDSVVMQSTGLLDKNSTEIYIGDILKWQGTMGHGWFEDVQDEVIYDKQELRFKFKNRNENIRNIANISVVAGNRFAHPRLLGEE